MTLTCDTCGRAVLIFRVFPGEADGEGTIDVKVEACTAGGAKHLITFDLFKTVPFDPDRRLENPAVLN